MKKTIIIICCIVIVSIRYNSVFAQEVIASQSSFEGMFDLYEDNRNNGIPNYITSDFILQAHGMLLEKLLVESEDKIIRPALLGLIKGLFQTPKKSGMSNISKGYISLLNDLIAGGSKTVELTENKLLAEELSRIRSANQYAYSQFFHQWIDYTRFITRGRYTDSKIRTNFFLAMTLSDSIFSPVYPSKSTGFSKKAVHELTQMAVEISNLICGDESLNTLYERIHDEITFWYGPKVDLSVKDYGDVTHEEYGLDKKPGAGIKTLERHHAKSLSVSEPGVPFIAYPVNKGLLEEKYTLEEVLTGWRLMPSRIQADTKIFNWLLSANPGDFSGTKKPFSLIQIGGKGVKGLPTGMELMAVLGSTAARLNIKQSCDTCFKGYETVFQTAEQNFKTNNSLISAHLGVLQKWFLESNENRNVAFSLNASLGFWTLLKSITFLSSRQSYHFFPKSAHFVMDRKKAYLEPAHKLFSNLNGILKHMSRSLKDKRLLEFSRHLEHLIDICKLEKKKRQVSTEDMDFLNELDLIFLQIIGEKDKPVVVDIHSEMVTRQVLQEGIGHPGTCEIKKNGGVFRGARYKYIEFQWPMENRMTNELWRGMLQMPEKMGVLTKNNAVEVNLTID